MRFLAIIVATLSFTVGCTSDHPADTQLKSTNKSSQSKTNFKSTEETEITKIDRSIPEVVANKYLAELIEVDYLGLMDYVHPNARERIDPRTLVLELDRLSPSPDVFQLKIVPDENHETVLWVEVLNWEKGHDYFALRNVNGDWWIAY